MPLPKPPAPKRADLLRRRRLRRPGRAQAGAPRRRREPTPSGRHRPLLELLERRRRCRRRSPPRRRRRRRAGGRAAPAAGAPPAARAPGRASRARTGPAKLFVLDTNVLMHDPMCLFRFEEHDIYLPMITLEELDGHKRGMTEVARNARQASRDARRAGRRAAAPTSPRRHHAGQAPATARPAASCSSRPTLLDVNLPAGLPQGKADNQILGVVQGAARAARRSAKSCWCPRTSTCASRRARWACRPRTTTTTRRSKTATCSTPASLPLPADFWEQATARRWKAGSRAATPSTASPGRWCRRC